MARHFKQPQPTPEVEDTRITGGLRGRRPNRRKQNTTSLPYGQAATYHYTYPSALPSEDYYTEERPARGGLRMLGRGLLLLLAWTFRIIAFGLVLLIIANFFLFPIGLSYVTFVTDTLTGFFPGPPSGSWASTPPLPAPSGATSRSWPCSPSSSTGCSAGRAHASYRR